MDQRTYELITQFITDRTGVRIVFADCTPQANIQDKVIYLPHNINDENVFAALAVTMHEAAHIQHTVFDHEKFTGGDPDKFEIVNALEDVRIDSNNFQLLPNIKEFYRCLFKKSIGTKSDEEWQQTTMARQILATLICSLEGFRSELKIDKTVDDFIKQEQLENKAVRLINTLTHLEHAIRENRKKDISGLEKEAGIVVDEIHNILFNKRPQQKQKQKQQGGGHGQGQGQGDGQGDDSEDCAGDAESEAGGAGDAELPGEAPVTPPAGGQQSPAPSKPSGSGNKQLGQDGVQKLLRRGIGDVFRANPNPSKGRGSAVIGEASLTEATKQGLRQLLNEKCIKEVSDGNVLDTDNLSAFHTGDIDELFKEHKLISRKKSKIVMMLDASGSMSDQMTFEPQQKHNVVVKNAMAIQRILDEVCEMEGMNVVYEVWAFSSGGECAWKCDNKDIKAGFFSHGCGGGTDIVGAFDIAHKSLMAPDVEGEKILIFITDGEVGEDQIEKIRHKIMWNNSNTKALIVGVGANINGKFVKEVIGTNNILAEKHSNIVLMEAIMQLLSN